MSFKALIARGNNHDAVRSFTHGRMVTAAELQQEIDIKRNGAYIDGLTGRSRRQLSTSFTSRGSDRRQRSSPCRAEPRSAAVGAARYHMPLNGGYRAIHRLLLAH